MTDEQFEKLISALQPKQTFHEKLVNHTVQGVILALILGFFATLWTASTSLQNELHRLSTSQIKTNNEIISTQRFLKENLTDIASHMTDEEDNNLINIGILKKAVNEHRSILREIQAKGALPNTKIPKLQDDWYRPGRSKENIRNKLRNKLNEMRQDQRQEQEQIQIQEE